MLEKFDTFVFKLNAPAEVEDVGPVFFGKIVHYDVEVLLELFLPMKSK